MGGDLVGQSLPEPRMDVVKVGDSQDGEEGHQDGDDGDAQGGDSMKRAQTVGGFHVSLRSCEQIVNGFERK